MPRIDAISKPASSRSGGGCAGVFVVGFLSLFVVIGVGSGLYLSIWPLVQVLRARTWTPTPCEVISSRVVHGDETSRPDIVYRYAVDDHVYTADRYDFLPGSRSDAQVPEVVARHAPGTRFECYVDPDDPTRAVINRTPTWWYGFGLIFLAAFGGVPGGIIWLMLRPARLPAASLPVSSASRPAFGGDPRFASFTSGDGGPLVLTPSATPVGKLAAAIGACLVWNGIIGVFTYFEVGLFIHGDASAWLLALFLLLFQAIGLLLLWNVPYQFLALTSPRPILTLGRRDVPLGTPVPLTWELSGAAHRVTALTITLRGREEAKYRQGTDTRTDTNEFSSEILVQATPAAGTARGTGSIRVPVGSMHTFTAPHNKIIWTLHVAGDVRRRPDIDATFELTVRPT